MPKPTALKKIERIKQMRSEGVGYEKIAEAIGVNESTAHKYGKAHTPAGQSHTLDVCGKLYNGLRCVRHNDHNGIHLTNDKRGRLVYWES